MQRTFPRTSGTFRNLQLWTFCILLSLLPCACFDPLGSDPPPEADGDTLPEPDRDGDISDFWNAPPQPWAIALVTTDYTSSSISIIDREAADLFRENILHSGSASAGLSVALSGDVVFPRRANPHNWIVLIDRYPNSVLTFVDPADFSVIRQLAVSTGFASNPRDFLWVSEEKAYISRYERNTQPGRQAFDEGDDLLIVNPHEGRISGRIDLSGFADASADPPLQARPSQMLWAKERVWVVLEHLSARFDGFGEGRLVAIDPLTDSVVETLSLPDVANCTALAYASGRESLYVACSGLLLADQAANASSSAIVQVDLSASPPRVTRIAQTRTAADGPFGFELDVADERWLLAIRFGSLTDNRPDRLVVFDLETGEERSIHESAGPFGLGGLLVDDELGRVYVGEADPNKPRIHRYTIKGGRFEAEGWFDPSPKTGLVPRHIRFY